MVTSEDIVSFWLTPDEKEIVEHHARLCSLGGRSNIREEDDRQDNLNEDQLYGQCCELAGWFVFYGRDEGLWQYHQSRETRNENPWDSDDGNDISIPNFILPIDVKGSRMRYGGDPLRYSLVYPLKEHNDDTIYILGLSDYAKLRETYVVHVVGGILGFSMPPPKKFKKFGMRRWTEATNLISIREVKEAIDANL